MATGDIAKHERELSHKERLRDLLKGCVRGDSADFKTQVCEQRPYELLIRQTAPWSIVSLSIFFTIIPKLETMNHLKYNINCTKCTHTRRASVLDGPLS